MSTDEPTVEGEDENEKALRELILQRVGSGCKATELVAFLATELLSNPEHVKIKERYAGDDGNEPMFQIIDRLIAEGEIIEIEYILPSATHTIKSFYLPKGSVVTLPQKDKDYER